MKDALKAWPSLCKGLKRHEHVALFLDYDGTLTPIVSRPELATLPGRTRDLIEVLKTRKRFIICIVSGRALADLKTRVGVEGITYVGNHGLEVEGTNLRFIHVKAQEARSLLKRICKRLNAHLKSVDGCLVEDKGLSLTFHYRLVRKKKVSTARDLFERAIQPYLARKEIKVNGGKEVLEVRPHVRWDKGKAILWVLREYRDYLKTDSVLPVYLGDDWTDESAFKAIGDRGVSIFVGKASSTPARFSLNNPKEVREFLERLLSLP